MSIGVLPDADPGTKRNLVSLKKQLFFKEQHALRSRIVERGNHGPAGNEEIYQRYFKYMPNRLYYVHEKYGLGRKRVLDIGSGRGEFLVHFGPGSVGLETDPERVDFARSIGLEVVSCNFEEPLPVKPGSFDAVWCSNVLEHVLAPHLLLRRAYTALADGGLLFMGVPTIPPRGIELVTRALIGWVGYRSMEHINAFTRPTLEFMIERAQFDVVESTVFVARNHLINRLAQPIVQPLGGQVVCVARKAPDRPRPHTYPPAWAGDL
jgi:SAM-dependent methyltransferase